MTKKIMKSLGVAVMIFILSQISAMAADYTIEAENFIDGNFEETTVNSITAATLFVDEADSIEMSFTLNERAEYIVELTGIMSMGEEFCSPVSYSIDDGDKVSLSESNTTKKSTLSDRWMAMPFAVYELNQTVILSEGTHTIKLYVDEPRSSDESYYVCAFDKIVLTGKEIKTSFTFDGFGDGYQKYQSDAPYTGNYYGQVYSEVSCFRSLDFEVAEAGWYDVEMSILADLTGTDEYVSNMLCSIDNGEKFTLTDDNCIDTGEKTVYWQGMGRYCKITNFSEPLYFEKGAHNITFYTEEVSSPGKVKMITAIDYVTISLATLKDFVITEIENGKTVSVTNYCEGDAYLDIVLSASDSASVKVIVNGNEYPVSASTFTDAGLAANALPNGMKKLRLNSSVHLSEGTNTIKVEYDSGVQVSSIALRAPRNIGSISPQSDNVVMAVGEEGTITLLDNSGKELTDGDVFSYSFSSDDEGIAEVNGFGNISAKRSGKTNISVSITVDRGGNSL